MKENSELGKALAWVVRNWEKVPDSFKTDITHEHFSAKEPLADVKKEGSIVVLLVNRQRPSVQSSWDFDEERFGINRFGQVIWGFDSGCSCPTPWGDSYPDCYKVTKDWKAFAVATAGMKEKTKDEYSSDFFDEGWRAEAFAKIAEIKKQAGGKK